MNLIRFRFSMSRGLKLLHPYHRKCRPPLQWASRRWFAVDFKKDYYGILDLDHKATDLEIKKAYLALAKVYHPDANSSKSEKSQAEAAKKFSTIKEAYDILSDKNLRAEVDREFVSSRFRTKQASTARPDPASYPRADGETLRQSPFARRNAKNPTAYWSKGEKDKFSWWQMDMSKEDREQWRERVMKRTYSRTENSEDAQLRYQAVENEKRKIFAKQVMWVIIIIVVIQFLLRIVFFNFKSMGIRLEKQKDEAASLREALDMQLAQDVSRLQVSVREKEGKFLPTRDRMLGEMRMGQMGEYEQYLAREQEYLSARNRRLAAGARPSDIHDESYVPGGGVQRP